MSDDQNVCACPTNGELKGLIKNVELTFEIDLEVLQRIHLDIPLSPDCTVYQVAQQGGTKKVSMPIDPELSQKLFNLSVNEPTSKEKRGSKRSRSKSREARGPKITTLESNVSSNIRNPEFSASPSVQKAVDSDIEEKVAPLPKVQPTKEAPKNLPKYSGSITRRAPKTADNNWSITVSAKNLPKMDLIGSCDPYFQFYLDDDFSHGDRSNALKNKREGSWTFSLPRSRIEAAKNFKIRWFDYDGIGKDDHMGDSTVAVQAVIQKILAGESNKVTVGDLRIDGKKCEKSRVSLSINTVW